ncbi:MAG: glycosyltransferase family 2 protein [Thiohalocapsa sp.]|jgi:glycosyltransferase involved in cell wall biosynthesis|uniref:glycosyltransferase family 2 protein n=1 Tax=Thiohalocapsa sp. TaxID=2497641 RepID=UPI0025FB3B89|nr:glycosyltransferase family 2 protein [Thiohalocapsa sp.]MCG6941243.1 glycosyltransferase family 2 protein [Thiohalocapsa sp.]
MIQPDPHAVPEAASLSASLAFDLVTGPATDPRSLSVVIPLYEEADNVAPLVQRVHEGLAAYRHPWELILVDDGSRDGTGERLQDAAGHYGPHVRVIRFRRNFGQTAAMQAGFDAARGHLVASLDGDLQNDPADIPRMVEELIDRDLDLLQGWRRNRQDALVQRKLPSRIANALIGRVTGVDLHDYGCSLKVYRAEIIKEVRLFGEMHRFIPVWVAGITAPERIGETEVGHRARERGESKYGISRTFRVLLDLLVAFFFLRYGARPGHFFGAIGLVFGAVGGLMMGWLVIVKFGLGEDIGHRPMLFVAILFLVASIQFLTTGILAEVLARTFFATGERTHHCIRWQTDPKTAAWKEAL